MGTMMMWLFAIGFLVGGIGIGVGIVVLIKKKPTTVTSGDLILTKDEDGIYLSVVMDEPPAALLNRKEVLFRIKNCTRL